jgi:hypothetical protein
MKIIVIVFLSCFILFFVSCKKEDQNYYVQDSFKEWALFNKGSYWIYLNENNNKLDSCFIKYSPIDYLYSENYGYTPNKGGIYYEIISYNVINIAEFFLSARIDDSYLLCEGEVGHDFINSYQVSANISQKISETCNVIKRYDTLVINNNQFYNVIYIRDSVPSYINNHSSYSVSNYFFARNIGLIKVATRDSTWSLIRWHTIQ